jgi:hypothetical protein
MVCSLPAKAVSENANVIPVTIRVVTRTNDKTPGRLRLSVIARLVIPNASM